ncbi:MAG: uncharacterized protein A8A55_3661, partial [Amphiamblys sp. WSBS2006]
RRPGLTPILDENNTLQTGEEEIDRTWRDHWAKVYRDESGFSKNKEFWEGAPITTRKIDVEELNREIDEAELETALRKLRNWKADGSDHTPPEIFKTAKPGSGFFFFLLRLF